MSLTTVVLVSFLIGLLHTNYVVPSEFLGGLSGILGSGGGLPLNNLNKQNPVSSVLKLDKLLKLSTSTTTTESSVKQDGSRSSGRAASLGQPDSPDLGGQDEIIGFLGVESLVNPVIKLSKHAPDSPMPERPCERTYYMGPFSEARWFSANASIKTRLDPTCSWTIIGTEACIPTIKCSHFELEGINSGTGKCAEYLQLYDGNKGFAKFCGLGGPNNIIPADDLKDLFIKYYTPKQEGPETPEELGKILKFNCSVSCTQLRKGVPLKKRFKPQVNELCSCGKTRIDNRIIGGVEAAKGEFPWMVALVQNNTRQTFCGGALINDRFVVTAAHCIKGIFMNIANLEVILNGHLMDTLPNMNVVRVRQPPKIYNKETLHRLDSENGSIRFSLEEIIIHPLYVTETNDFDTALLKLSTPVDLMNMTFLNPICLPKLGSFLRTFATMNATVAGWGLAAADANATNPTLQKLVMRVFPPNQCKAYYAHRVNRRMICAGYENGTRDSCMGDSGGPLMSELYPETWFELGTVSWGEGCGISENPGVYFRTTETGPWIHFHSNTNNAIWCAVPGAASNSNSALSAIG